MPNDNHMYVRLKDIGGANFFCPINEIQNQPSEGSEIDDNCVEESVVGRYAGNVRLKTT